jgi:indolepyruvate ferredoxin oxidoreductase beta subunit
MVDVYLVGVGGQGIITASKIIGDAALLAGEQVVLSETHGMAQRGGSVVCTARIGDRAGPLVPDFGADVILSLELLETLRAVCKASKDTVVLSSTERIVPLSVSTQKMRYPSQQDVVDRMASAAKGVVMVDAAGLAGQAGVPMSSNVVMVGALAGSGATGIDRAFFDQAVRANIPRKLDENLKAFALGYETGKKVDA